jgi:hypothetical protein
MAHSLAGAAPGATAVRHALAQRARARSCACRSCGSGGGAGGARRTRRRARVREALAHAGGAGLVLLCGSLFAVGEAMEVFGGAPGEWL